MQKKHPEVAKFLVLNDPSVIKFSWHPKLCDFGMLFFYIKEIYYLEKKKFIT